MTKKAGADTTGVGRELRPWGERTLRVFVTLPALHRNRGAIAADMTSSRHDATRKHRPRAHTQENVAGRKYEATAALQRESCTRTRTWEGSRKTFPVFGIFFLISYLSVAHKARIALQGSRDAAHKHPPLRYCCRPHNFAEFSCWLTPGYVTPHGRDVHGQMVPTCSWCTSTQ